MAGKRGKLPTLLQDLVLWGEKAERLVGKTSPQAILQDETAELALSRAVEIVGEIAGRLLSEHPEWSADHDPENLTGVYRMRNRLAHGYDAVSPDVLYGIAQRDVARLTAKARRWRTELDADEP